jgi:hypothetical protein
MAEMKSVAIFSGGISGTKGVVGSITSQAINMRERDAGTCGVTYSIAGTGGAATCGSTLWEYLGCASESGSYVAAGTFGTIGADNPSGLIGFAPAVVPWIKIKVSTGTSNAAAINANFHSR